MPSQVKVHFDWTWSSGLILNPLCVAEPCLPSSSLDSIIIEKTLGGGVKAQTIGCLFSLSLYSSPELPLLVAIVK